MATKRTVPDTVQVSSKRSKPTPGVPSSADFSTLINPTSTDRDEPDSTTSVVLPIDPDVYKLLEKQAFGDCDISSIRAILIVMVARLFLVMYELGNKETIACLERLTVLDLVNRVLDGMTTRLQVLLSSARPYTVRELFDSID